MAVSAIALFSASSALPAPTVRAGAAEPAEHRYPAAFLCSGTDGEPSAGASLRRDTLVVVANPSDRELDLQVVVRGDEVTTLERRLPAGARVSFSCADVPDGAGDAGFIDIGADTALDVVATYQTTMGEGADGAAVPPERVVAGVSVIAQLERHPKSDAEHFAFGALGLQYQKPVTLLVLTDVATDDILVPAETARRSIESQLSAKLQETGMSADAADAHARHLVTETMKIWVELDEVDVAQGGSGDVAVSLEVVTIAAAGSPGASTVVCTVCDPTGADDDGGDDVGGDENDGDDDDDGDDDGGDGADDDPGGDDDDEDGGDDDGDGDDSDRDGPPGDKDGHRDWHDHGGTAGPVIIPVDDGSGFGWCSAWLLWLLVILTVLLILAFVLLLLWLFRRFWGGGAVVAPPPVVPPPPAAPTAYYEITCAFEGERHIDVDDREATLRITMVLKSPDGAVSRAHDASLSVAFDFTDQRIAFEGRNAGRLRFDLRDHTVEEPLEQTILVSSGAFSGTDLDAASADVGSYSFEGTVTSQPEPPQSDSSAILTTAELDFAVARD